MLPPEKASDMLTSVELSILHKRRGNLPIIPHDRSVRMQVTRRGGRGRGRVNSEAHRPAPKMRGWWRDW